MGINQRIKQLRTDAELTQSKVAETLGINRSTYANFELNTEPDISTLVKLADFYGLSLDNLLDRSFNKTPQKNSFVNPFAEMSKEGFAKIVSEDDLRKRFMWKTGVRNRRFDNQFLYMMYLLKALNAYEIQSAINDTVRRITRFVLNDIFGYINCDEINSNKYFEFTFEINKRIHDLCVALNNQHTEHPNPQIKDAIFTSEELLGKDSVKKFFAVNLNEIITGEIKE